MTPSEWFGTQAGIELVKGDRAAPVYRPYQIRVSLSYVVQDDGNGPAAKPNQARVWLEFNELVDGG
jgi:hypothetical protein